MSELIKREDVQREIQSSFNLGAFRWQDGQDLMDRINALPIIDAVPVVHGEWILPEFQYAWYKAKCSVCGYEDQTSWGGKIEWHDDNGHYGEYWFPTMKFCPNCGAKMDEGRTNNERSDQKD